jgi:hypothetical protein
VDSATAKIVYNPMAGFGPNFNLLIFRVFAKMRFGSPGVLPGGLGASVQFRGVVPLGRLEAHLAEHKT